MTEGSEPTDEAMAGSAERRGSRRIVITAVVAIAVVVVVIFAVMLSPKYSLLASVHDADGDGVADNEDLFPDDPDEWDDSDSDGVGDNSDEYPSEPSQWLDGDGDSYGDNISGVSPDVFPNDPNEWNDTDLDGVGDNGDMFPENPDEWNDTDGDGYGDNSDAFPEDESRSTPVVRFHCDERWDGFGFECIYTDMPLAWNEIAFSLTDYISTVVWTNASSSALSCSLNAIQHLGIGNIAGIAVTLIVGDIIGNGVLEVGDTFSISAEDGFVAGVDFLLEVIYEPTGGTMETLTFIKALPETPASALTRVAVTSGFQFAFLSLTIQTQWSDITIQLSDGEDIAQWAPSTSTLTGEGVTQYVFAMVTLGPLSIFCNVTDLGGNGYINWGDYFRLTTSGVAFSSATEYTVTIVHEPTVGTICTLSFYG